MERLRAAADDTRVTPVLDLGSVRRAMLALSVGGPALLGLWLALPHSPEADERSLVALAVASLLLGVWLAVAPAGRPTRTAVRVVPFVATVDLTLALVSTHTALSGFAFLYLWTVCWTFLTESVRAAAAHLALMGVGLAVAYSTFAPAPTWATWAVGVATVGLTGLLARRLAIAMVRADERFRTGFRESAIGMALVSPDGQFSEANEALCELLGTPRSTMLASSPRDMCFPGEAQLLDHHFGLALAGQPQRFRKRCRHADGHEVNALIDLAVVGDARPMVLVHAQDVSGEVQAQRALEHRLEQQRTIARFAPEALEAPTPGSAVDAARRAASALFGGAPSTVYARGDPTAGPVVPGTERGEDATSPAVKAALAGRGPTHDAAGGHTHAVTIPGEARPWGALAVHDVGSTGPDDLAALDSVAQMLGAALRRAHADARLRHHELHDALTGLPNRELMLDRLATTLTRATAASSQVAVLLLDLDRFAVVNDSLGHEAGDELLVELSFRLSQALPGAVELGRLGGDEFIVVAEVTGGAHHAVELARQVQLAVHEPIAVGDRQHFVTTSIGIALSAGSGAQGDALIRDADAAMHRAKDRGRARYELFDSSLRADIVRRVKREAELRRALSTGALEVHYQPIVAVADGCPAAVEALVRWRHPREGLLSAAEFVPLAEECGLIGPLGELVLRQACRDLAAWRLSGALSLEVWVNVSGEQLVVPSFAARVAEAIDDAGIDAEGLVLELTESTLIRDPALAGATIDELHALGVRLALDDFGVGYSALGTLHHFAFDALKVDRSFVAGIAREKQRGLLRAIVDMSRALSLDVVAEGVEEPEQLAVLHELDCRLAQGFLFSRPVPASDVLGLLQSEQATVYSLVRGPRDRGSGGAAAGPRRAARHRAGGPRADA